QQPWQTLPPENFHPAAIEHQQLRPPQSERRERKEERCQNQCADQKARSSEVGTPRRDPPLAKQTQAGHPQEHPQPDRNPAKTSTEACLLKPTGKLIDENICGFRGGELAQRDATLKNGWAQP